MLDYNTFQIKSTVEYLGPTTNIYEGVLQNLQVLMQSSSC